MKIFDRILKHPLFMKFEQFIKFGLVGLSNTAISYGVEQLVYYVMLGNVTFNILSVESETVKVVLASAIAFIVSVTNSYYWNNRFVFASGAKRFREHLRLYLRTVACYGITGLIISPVIKTLLVNASVMYWAASLASLIVTVPLNFVMNKFWAFKPSPGDTAGGEN